MTEKPARAKLIGGVWLPETDEHFVDMMLHNKKRIRVVEGKHTYQYHKIKAAMARQPPERRRVCVDIGAHVGLWSMWLTGYFRHVRAFEPVPHHGDIFPFNVDMTKATLHRAALGRREGTIAMAVPHRVTGNAHVSERGHAPNRRAGDGPGDKILGVPMRTLDSFGFSQVDFIKIDVEGFELPVVEGAAETIKRWRPNMIVEQKGMDVGYGDAPGAAVTLLKSWGMREIVNMGGDWIMGW